MTDAKKNTSQKWTLADLIAFECAIAHDEREDWQLLKERDSAVTRVIPEKLWEERDRRSIARVWLSERLRQSPSVKLAADSLRQSIGVAGQLLAAGGAIAGLASATLALAYTGQAPINVSAFFGLFVLLQAVLAVVVLIPFLLPQSVRERLLSGPLLRFAKFLFGLFLKKTLALANRFLEAQRREKAAEIAGVVRSRLSLHQSVFKWLAFNKLQSSALAFNLAALGTLLLAVVFSDRAFGWQTTLDVSAESIHEIVKTVATPWSWLFEEGTGYPSVSDIDGSRIVLKDGIQALRTENLVVWWRFLALGIVAYGLLPRLVFRLLGAFQLRRALQRYDFANAGAQRLFNRLSPRPGRFDVEAVAPSNLEDASRDNGGLAVAAETTREKVSCLLEASLASTLDVEALREALARHWNLPLSNVETLIHEGGSMSERTSDVDTGNQLAMVFESWMPPIKESERQIRQLRTAIGPRRLIRIVPLGLPEQGNGISLRPAEPYRNTWDAFVRRLGDPYLILDHHSG